MTTKKISKSQIAMRMGVNPDRVTLKMTEEEIDPKKVVVAEGVRGMRVDILIDGAEPNPRQMQAFIKYLESLGRADRWVPAP